MQPQIKIIGTNGQISLGKEFAGKMVLINQLEDGTWIIKSGEFIPDSERWVHQPKNKAKLDRALNWAEKNKPKNNFDEWVKKIENKNV